MFYFLHEYSIESSFIDVTRQKDYKYIWLPQHDEKQLNDVMDQFRDVNVFRIFKNLISFNETVLNALVEKQQNTLQFREMQNLKKILIHGSNIIQHYSEMVFG